MFDERVSIYPVQRTPRCLTKVCPSIYSVQRSPRRSTKECLFAPSRELSDVRQKCVNPSSPLRDLRYSTKECLSTPFRDLRDIRQKIVYLPRLENLAMSDGSASIYPVQRSPTKVCLSIYPVQRSPRRSTKECLFAPSRELSDFRRKCVSPSSPPRDLSDVRQKSVSIVRREILATLDKTVSIQPAERSQRR